MDVIVEVGIFRNPELARLLGGHDTEVARRVGAAVRRITGTDDPVAAQARLDADAEALSALQKELAAMARELAGSQRPRVELDALVKSIDDARSERGRLSSRVGRRAVWPVAAGVIAAAALYGFFAIPAWNDVSREEQVAILTMLAISAAMFFFFMILMRVILRSRGTAGVQPALHADDEEMLRRVELRSANNAIAGRARK
jgi:hypothetical protein